MARTCSECRFWWNFSDGDDGDDGECRRYAPRVTVLGALDILRANQNDDPVHDRWVDSSEDARDLSVKRQWPETHRSDWCGEQEPRPPGQGE